MCQTGASAKSSDLRWLARPWGQLRSTVVLGPLCHSLYRVFQASSALLHHTESQEKGYTTFIAFPLPPLPAQGKGMCLPSCPRAPAWPGSVLLATCRGITLRGAGEKVGATILPGRTWAPTQEERPSPSAPPFLGPLSGLSVLQESGGCIGVARHLKGMQELGWRVGPLLGGRKEMGLAPEPSAQADVEHTEMGRSQQRAGGG